MSNSYNILEMYDEITENLRISFSVFLLSSVVNHRKGDELRVGAVWEMTTL